MLQQFFYFIHGYLAHKSKIESKLVYYLKISIAKDLYLSYEHLIKPENA